MAKCKHCGGKGSYLHEHGFDDCGACNGKGTVRKKDFYVRPCSGCYESNEGQPNSWDVRDKNGVILGQGCHECGYTGKRRHYFSVNDFAEMT